jgi:hypothetical protein
VVRFSQPLLPHVDQARAFEPARRRVDPAQARRDSRVLPHVRVHEQLPARTQDAVCFREHAAQRVRRQVLQNVERARLRERAIGKRQPAQVAEQQIELGARFG